MLDVLEHVRDNSIGLPWATVINGCTVTEDFQGPGDRKRSARNPTPLVKVSSRVALDTMFLTQLGLVNTVDLGDRDALLLQSSGSLLVLGGECLAMPTPNPYVSQCLSPCKAAAVLTMGQRIQPR